MGLNATSEAKLFINKVKEYTNLSGPNSWKISSNETALNKICEYAVNAKMSGARLEYSLTSSPTLLIRSTLYG